MPGRCAYSTTGGACLPSPRRFLMWDASSALTSSAKRTRHAKPAHRLRESPQRPQPASYKSEKQSSRRNSHLSSGEFTPGIYIGGWGAGGGCGVLDGFVGDGPKPL